MNIPYLPRFTNLYDQLKQSVLPRNPHPNPHTPTHTRIHINITKRYAKLKVPQKVKNTQYKSQL